MDLWAPIAIVLVLGSLPIATGIGDYHLHLLVLMLIWGFVYTSWSVMGRFGLVSLGHGAFMGIGAYGVTLLWNHFGLSPWLGGPIALAVAALFALAIGWPCFRFRITGHYFALVTLAATEIVRLVIVALRDVTGGSLGMTPKTALAEGPVSLSALQFAAKEVWLYIALLAWLGGVLVWRAVDRSMLRYALEAAGQDEDAAASIGVDVTRAKLAITLLSAVMTATGGILYAQYQLYVAPETVSGIGISLQIVFAVIAGGMYVQLGPTVGAVFTLALSESLRVAIGHTIPSLDGLIYGLLLVLFIVYMPKGILGQLLALAERRSLLVFGR
ncbi:MAG: branched-chain amino acid ABC transporter permease [Geminicoccaceae bacterium]|nr:branched-chain amino acid ABC transporter permease [Geminicoccaceae bacterium]MCS7267810.1 branched-chain amino acid ABC transporter permease [Geminicoccaceae bacterium]MCX7630075.1 branched-chain amino acid ABC transporter permease [Geminicoccaceae bacterium]MDW8124364.1 branched-chain amino acid ABC transporter permease [Geminicoccaceae bacterium]MDW8341833.1 branched-chain amino acid ABC transporter permease [Geminicoccaceae bacterium]